MYDIFFISYQQPNANANENFFKLKSWFPTLKIVKDFNSAQQKSLTKMFWCIWDDVLVLDDFDFSFKPDEWDQKYIHVFKNKDTYDGIILCPKNIEITQREKDYRFFVNKKEVNIQASTPKPYDVFEIDSYEDYESALETSSTDLFWMSSRNIKADTSLIDSFYISHHNSVDRKQNHTFIHRVNDKDLKNGLFLCSKHALLSKREVEYRFPTQRKEWDIVGSRSKQYDVFEITTYDEYLNAFENSSTEMFWMIPDDVSVNDDFKFDLYFSHDNVYDREINHVFKNGDYYDGITLFSKKSKVSQKEFEYRFYANKKEVDIQASTPKPYDVVFISYNEPNADKNYDLLLEKIPNAKRIHGVKGIHNAHIEAAKICKTDMIWIVDGDAQIMDDFKFDYQVPKWHLDQVHVWNSINPINDLVYGYGGVKLLPRKLTLKMDTSKSDMTTSISTHFKAVDQVANITAFNTDPFSTWRSAFRECVKLASKTIQGQIDDETTERLRVWTEFGTERQFGNYAIKGAREGMNYGITNRNNLNKLALINDFKWLEKKFKEA